MPPLPLPTGSVIRSRQHRAGDRVGDDQRRAGEEVGLQVRVDARLEVAVARQHGGADQVVLGDRVVDLGRQVAGVADAGGAAVGGDVEAELLEVGQQAGLGQVLGDDARARRERGLDVRLRPSGRASTAFFASRPAASSTLGFEVLVHEVIAAISTSPLPIVMSLRARLRRLGLVQRGGERRLVGRHLLDEARRARRRRRRASGPCGAVAVAVARVLGGAPWWRVSRCAGRLVEAVLGRRLAEQRRELLLDVAELDPVLRPLRAGQARRDRAEVERDDLACSRSAPARGTPNRPCALK